MPQIPMASLNRLWLFGLTMYVDSVPYLVTILVEVACAVGQVAEGGIVQHARVNIAGCVGWLATEV